MKIIQYEPNTYTKKYYKLYRDIGDEHTGQFLFAVETKEVAVQLCKEHSMYYVERTVEVPCPLVEVKQCVQD